VSKDGRNHVINGAKRHLCEAMSCMARTGPAFGVIYDKNVIYACVFKDGRKTRHL